MSLCLRVLDKFQILQTERRQHGIVDRPDLPQTPANDRESVEDDARAFPL